MSPPTTTDRECADSPPPLSLSLKREGLYSYLQRPMWLTLGPLGLALVLATAGLIYLVHQQRVSKVQAVAQKVARELDASISRRMHGLAALAVEAGWPHQNLAQLHDIASAYDNAFDAPMLLVDTERRIWLSSRRPLGAPLPLVPDTPGPSALDTVTHLGEPAVGAVVQCPILEVPVIPIMMPASGVAAGKAWVTSVPVDHYRGPLISESVPSGWTITVLDRAGRTIVSSGQHGAPDIASVSSQQHASADIRLASWSAVAQVDTWTFYRPHLNLGAALLLILGSTVAAALWLGKRSTRKLYAAVAELADERRGGSTGFGTAPRIAEIELVHEKLHRLRHAEHEAEGKERQRIARELHDGLQQYLAASQMSVQMAHDLIVEHNREAALLLQDSTKNSRHVVDELRHIINKLRPAALEHLGLLPALEHLVSSVADATGLQIELELAGPANALDALPKDHADCLYRAVQESLNNVRKHAQASFVHVLVDVSDPRVLMLQVSDDGVGLIDEAKAQPQGFGLAGMQQRVSAMGGSLEVERGHDGDPTRGTTVRARCPLG